jgi:phospholipid N-methyltransferase
MSELEITNDQVFVGVPQERFGLHEFYAVRDRVLGMLQNEEALVSNVFQIRSHRVDINRDKITEAFLTHPDKPDWLLMLDSDMDHPPSCGLRLREWRKPIVGGLYFHRSSDRGHDPMAFQFTSFKPDGFGHQVPHWVPVRDIVYKWLRKNNVPFTSGSFVIGSNPPEALVPVDAIGTGCIMIHRSVFDEMEQPYWEYRTRQGSEDLDFCRRASEVGIQAYLDMSIVCGHYALTAVGHPNYMNVYRNRGYYRAAYTEDEAIDWLTRFAKMKDAEERLLNYDVHELGRIWTGLDIKSGKEAKAYYRRKDVGEQYLLDLSWWNTTPVFSKIRSQLVGHEGKKVLEIGAGIGTVAIQMVMQGNDVDAVEINPTLRNFAKKRHKDILRKDGGYVYASEDAGALRWLNDVPKTKKQYDLIIAIDTFEHLPAPALAILLAQLASKLPLNGRIFCHNTWSEGAYPMHYDNSKIWHELLEDAGLFELSEYWVVKIRERN